MQRKFVADYRTSKQRLTSNRFRFMIESVQYWASVALIAIVGVVLVWVMLVVAFSFSGEGLKDYEKPLQEYSSKVLEA